VDKQSVSQSSRRHPARLNRRVMAALGAGVIGFVGVGTPTTTARADDRPVIRVAYTETLDSLNPFVAVLKSSTDILRYQYEPLVQFAAKDNAVAPGMADAWEVSGDAKKWTFHLDPKAKWSDGEPITADDVVWTIEAIQSNDALKKKNGSLVKNVKSVTPADNTTVVMDLTEPQASNPGIELPIVPKHIWSKVHDPAAFANDTATVGSGPFIINKFSKTSGVQLTVNAYYRGGPAKVSGVIFVPYESTDAAVQALKTGEVDIMSGLTPAQFETLQKVDNITAIAGTGRRYVAIAINPGAIDTAGKPMGDGNAALHDPVLRRAIVRAIDNNTLLGKVLHGLGARATGEIPTAYPLYQWVTDSPPLSFDPKEANKLLDDAGYTTGSDGIRLDPSGNPLKLRIMGLSTEPIHQQIVDYIKPWLKDIGIEITAEIKSPAQVNDDSARGNYDLYFTEWGIAPDPDYQLSLNLCSSRPNPDGTGATSESNWCSPQFDELYNKQHSELDQEKRSKYVIDAQKLIYDAAVNDVLFYPQALQAYRSDRFGEFVTQPAQGGVILSQNGPWGLYSATPVAAWRSSGGGNILWWVLGGVVVVGIAMVIGVIRRRSRTRG
jgi:peptide/nickel transport system substrate-binding protein